MSEYINHKTVHNILGQQLNKLYSKIYLLNNYTTRLHALLPNTYAKECQVTSFAQGELVIAVSNAAILTRLRYMTQELIGKLSRHEELKNIVTIRFFVLPAQETTYQPVAKEKTLSASSKQLLRSVAEHIGDDKLKCALLKLAQ